MSKMDTIDLSGDEGEEEIGSVADKRTIASDSKTTKTTTKATTVAKGKAQGKAQRKLKPNTSDIRKRQRKLTSPVWNYFKILDDTDENENLVCLCNQCGVKYIAESSHGTGNMLRHGRACKGNTCKDVGQFILKTGLNGSLGTHDDLFRGCTLN